MLHYIPAMYHALHVVLFNHKMLVLHPFSDGVEQIKRWFKTRLLISDYPGIQI